MSAAAADGTGAREPGAREPARARESEGARSGPAEAGDASGEDRIPLRLVMPDRWLEHVEELPLSTTVEEAKRLGLRRLLDRDTDDPDDFYVEYAERQVPDESVTLREIGAQPREILSIRAYDLGHYPRFRG